MRSPRHHIPLGAAVIALLSGCATTTAGQAAPASAVGPGSSGGLPSDGAPAVARPLETAGFREDPCRALTREQSAEQFGLSPTGRLFRAAMGNGCEWRSGSSNGHVQVSFRTENRRGLSADYALHDERYDGVWAYFDPLEIGGLPAVARTETDNRPRGECVLVVGATDEVTFEVRLQQSRANIGSGDPCGVATTVADAAVRTMRG